MNRKSFTHLLLLLVLSGLTACPHVAFAQGIADLGVDQIAGLEISAAVNLPAKNIKVEGKMFLPDRTRSVRAVIVVTNYTLRHQGIGINLFYTKQLRTSAQACQCALIYAWLGTIRPIDANTPTAKQFLRNAGVGGDDALLLLLQRLGNESGHRELKDAPLLFFGWSATASFGTTFAELHPDRTIAFIRYHTHRRGMTANLDVLKNIPALIIAGGKDETAGVQDAEEFWASGRAVGAPWTFAIEPNATHGDEDVLYKTANDLVTPWIAAVLRDRLALNATKLKPLVENTGYLGDNHTAQTAPHSTFLGSKPTVSWLPDEATARGWRNVITSAK
jgi:hypothetical protein